MESQLDIEADYENDKLNKIQKIVTVVFIIDTTDGFTQLRFDSPGQFHSHKNNGKSTEGAFEEYYKDILGKLFPDLLFTDMNLNAVANHISNNEKEAFLLNKGVTTITDGAKQTFASPVKTKDVRNLPEYMAAAAKANGWLSEDLTGYWLAAKSNGELNRDLFMRISRKFSQIRVQRGCMEKELNYGIDQIRKIQKGV